MADWATEWRRVFRDGFAPSLSGAELAALADALRTDDVRLTQGSTTTPPPLMCVQDWPVEAACALGYVGAVRSGGFGAATVGECEEVFARLCFEADERLGGAGQCRHFLNFFDDTPRNQMRAALLPEVEAVLEQRKAVAA